MRSKASPQQGSCFHSPLLGGKGQTHKLLYTCCTLQFDVPPVAALSVAALSPLPSQFSTIFLMVFGGEVLADWIKHGFIIKFNQLTPSIYDEYSTILARSVGGLDSS